MKRKSIALVLAIMVVLSGFGSVSVYADEVSPDLAGAEPGVQTADELTDEVPAVEEEQAEALPGVVADQSATIDEKEEQESDSQTNKGAVVKLAAGEKAGEAEGWDGDMYYTANAKNGTYYTQEDGPVQIEDQKYYFDQDGHLWNTAGVVTVGSEEYFVNSKGVVAVGRWVFLAGEKVYYAQTSGALYVNTKVKIDSYTRIFDSNGKLIRGPKVVTFDDAKYYVNENGVVRMSAGLVTVSGKKYYVKSGGVVAAGQWIFKDGKKVYYAQSTGALYVNKKVKVGGYTRIFDSTGKLVTGPKLATFNGGKYYVNKKGVVKTTAGVVTVDGKKYYATASGKGKIRTTPGFVTLNGNKYYVLNKKGWLATSTMKTISGSKYIFASTGKVRKGLVKYSGNYYYCYTSSGKVRTKTGMYQTQNKKAYVYVSGSTGKLATKKMIKVDGSKYIFKSDARRAKGIVILNGNYYYCSTKTGAVRTKSGKFKYKGKWYYSKSGGVLYRNAFIVNDEIVYHASSKAYLNTSAFTKKATSGDRITLHPNATTARIPWSEYAKLFPYPAAPSNTEPCVLVDISDQTLYYYENGKLVFKTPVVTGKIYGTVYHGTPKGTFHILYKQRDTVLKGLEDDGKTKYESPVSYWMPFTSNGFGLHDATWRSSFGGTIYQYSGSHGCVNMPYKYAQKLYKGIKPGSIVKIRQ